jgi:NADPH:quinone reductase-like Zn-dependent oxidoreductase
MKAAWYEKQGAARDVLVVGNMDDPQPDAGEVRIRIAFSGVNPGDVKKREDAFGVGMPYPRVIPHGDGSGTFSSLLPPKSKSKDIRYRVLPPMKDSGKNFAPPAVALVIHNGLPLTR